MALLGALAATEPVYAQTTDDRDDEAVIRADAADADRARVEARTGFASSLDLRQRGPTAESLGDALEEAPGVHVRRLGDGLSPQTLTLRGAPGAQVTVALDGVVLNDSASDGVDVSLLAPALLERADVYRGSAPMRLGVSGLGGAIELVTRRAPYRSETWASVGYGSFGARRASVFVAGRLRALRTMLSVGYRGTDGDFSFYDDRGTPLLPGVTSVRRNSGANAIDLLARACVGERVSRAPCVMALVTWRNREVPGVGGIQTDGPYSEQARVLLRAGVPWVSRVFSGQLTAAFIAREDHFANRGPTTLFLTMPFDTRSTTWLAELGAETTDTLSSTRFDTVLKARAERYIPSSSELDAARLSLLAGVEASTTLGRLRLVGTVGVQALNDSRGVDDIARGLFSPRLGASLRLTDALELRANVGRFERPPSLGELYGDRGVISGNPALRPEQADNVDLGAVFNGARRTLRVRLELASYARRVVDLISLVQTSRQTFRPVNLDRATVLGLEALVRVSVARRFSMTASYTLTDATTDPVGAGATERFRVPGVPLHDLSGSLEGTLGPLSAGVNASFASISFLSTANVSEVPSRWLLGAQVAFTPPFARWCSAQLAVTNLLDVRTAYASQRLASGRTVEGVVPLQDFFGYPLPGRSVFFSLTAHAAQ